MACLHSSTFWLGFCSMVCLNTSYNYSFAKLVVLSSSKLFEVRVVFHIQSSFMADFFLYFVLFVCNHYVVMLMPR